MKEITPEKRSAADEQIKQFQHKIGFDTKEFTVEVLCSQFTKNPKEIFIPEYQRRFVWHAERKSKFIESMLLGLPIPYMFFAEQEDGTFEVVDGCQRVNTINSFLSNEFHLTGLKKLAELNGFSFKDLPSGQQRKFRNRTLRIISLNDTTPLEIRLDIFERINTGSDSLRGAETRRGANKGLMSDLLEECSKMDIFKKVCPLSDSRKKRHEDKELILRLFAYSDDYESFKHSVKDFLDDYLKRMNKSEDFNVATKELYRQHFINVMNFADNALPWGFARSEGSTLVPRVRFEALAVGISRAIKENPDLSVPKKVDWLTGKQFKSLTTSDASNSPRKLKDRIEYVRKKLS